MAARAASAAARVPREMGEGISGGDRFKSVVAKDGNTLINCLAYIDLNPVRAGLVERPEDYRFRKWGRE